MIETLIVQFIYAILSTLGFALIFRVPSTRIPVCALVGALGWMAYQISIAEGFTSVMAIFMGACIVALFSDFFSKIMKEAATVFIIPGIMCLVPGAGMYKMMLELIHNNIDGFAVEATQTLLSAGAIAVGLLVMGSLLKILRMITNKIKAAF